MTQLLNSWTKLPLAFGGASISGEGGGYGFGTITETEAIELLLKSYESGFRIFDSAPIYGFGLSEKRMGKAFKNIREKVKLISKSGVTWDTHKRVDMSNDPVVATKMLEQSLRDFDSDYIDLYMIHWPDNRVDIRKPMEILAKAKHEGKILHIGLCNTNLDDIAKASEIEKIEVIQNEFNFFQNKAKEELFPFIKKNNLSFMSWGTLDKGILTGRVDELRKFDQSDCRSWAPWWKSADNKPKYDAMRKLWPMLDSHGHSGLELALGYNLSFSELSVAICGVRNIEQLDSVIKAISHLPSKDVITEAQNLAK